MKIALIEPVGGHGGMDYYDYGLAYGLGLSGCHVFYFTCKDTQIRQFENVTTKYTFGDIWENNKVFKGIYFVLGYLYSFFSAKRAGCRIIHLHFFDLKFLNKVILILARRLFGFKIVVTIHDVEPLKNDDKEKQNKEIFNLIDKIILHNEFSRQELVSKGGDKRKTHVIPHGNYLPFVEELNYKYKENGKLKLLFFGQIKEPKGLDILLRALVQVTRKTEDVQLTIAGRPWHDEIEKYQGIIDKYDLTPYVDTRFEFIPDEEVSGYFSEADLVVLPYKRIYQSGVLLLSMSHGRPVLASDLEAFREIIEHNNTGILFESENTADLAEKIIDASENPEKLRRIRNHASDLLKTKFDWQEIGKLTSSVYSNLLINE